MPTQVKGGIRGDGKPPKRPPGWRDPRLFVVGNSRAQFYHWCTSRGWAPNDRGIIFIQWDERSFLGRRWIPGDLVITLENVEQRASSRWTRAAREFHRAKAWCDGTVGFRNETTLP